MNTTKTAEEIFDYMSEKLANGVDISEEDKTKMVDEIQNILFEYKREL